MSSLEDARQQLADFSQSTFTELQHDYHELNHEIQKDSPLEEFRHEYAKLFSILQKSMTNQTRFIDKCRVLDSEIVGNKAKVRTVTKLAEEDARSISSLSDERDKKSAILAENQGSLREAMEENAQVTAEIQQLETRLEECVMSERGQRDLLRQLRGRRAELTKQHEELRVQNPQLQEANKATMERVLARERDVEEAVAELRKVEEMLTEKHAEGQQAQQRLMEAERTREATRERLKEAQVVLKERQVEVAAASQQARQGERRAVDNRKRLESITQERQDALDRNAKAMKEIDGIEQEIASIEATAQQTGEQATQRGLIVKALREQLAAKTAELERIRATVDKERHTYEAVRQEGDEARRKLKAMTEQIERLQRDAEALRKRTDAAKREENGKLKERQIKQQKEAEAQGDLASLKSQGECLDAEISIIKSHLGEIQRQIYGIEMERDAFDEELSSTTSQLVHAQEVHKELEEKVRQKTKDIQEAERRVRHQQALYEQTRSERETAAKKVKEVEGEIKTLHGMFARLKFAIEQHKDEIRRREKERVFDAHQLEQIQKDDGRLRERLTEMEIQAETAQRAIIAHEGEIAKAVQAIKVAEGELAKEEESVAALKRERDQATTQTVQRELELKALHERLQALRNQCERGRVDYDTRESEIQAIRQDLARDRERVEALGKIREEVGVRRREIHAQQKELLRLRAERAAMEDELKIPINVHRWTLLESADPARFELLRRFQELQADLMQRTRQVEALAAETRAKEQEYAELAAQQKRRPGAEIEHDVGTWRSRLKEEGNELARINEQLELFRDVAKQYAHDLAEVKSQLAAERERWVRKKRKALVRREKLREEEKVLAELGIKLSEEQGSVQAEATVRRDQGGAGAAAGEAGA